MDQDRAFFHVADVLRPAAVVEVMAVDRADIIEAESSNSVPPSIMKRGIFLDAVGAVGEDLRQALVDLLGRLAQRAIGLAE